MAISADYAYDAEICLAEAVLLIVNGTSIFDYIEKYRAGEALIAAFMC